MRSIETKGANGNSLGLRLFGVVSLNADHGAHRVAQVPGHPARWYAGHEDVELEMDLAPPNL